MYYNDKTRQFHVFYFWLIKEKKIGFSVNVCIVSSVCLCFACLYFVYLVKLATVTFWNACGLFEIPQRHSNPKYLFLDLFMAQLETNIHITKFRNSLCFSQLFRQTIFIHILFSIRMTRQLFYCIFVLPFSTVAFHCV